MSLLAAGDPLPHRHDLPEVPSVPVDTGILGIKRDAKLKNAVCACRCGKVFVSRMTEYGIAWMPLRPWHQAAIRKLRALGE